LLVITWEFSTISSSNYKEKYKEWNSSVCRRFVTRITLLKKSMLLITLKHQNCVKPLSGSKLTNFLTNLILFYVRNIFK